MAEAKGRREEPTIFFVYDHNMLKKEEDDLKDAILYFFPEEVSADDQCALCGPLMGTCEFLESTLSKANPQMYKFEQKKFALKRVGSYSLVSQGRSAVPDSLLRGHLDRLYTTFVTFCGSIDSLRLRFRESHAGFLQELANVWRSILSVAGGGSPSSTAQIFGKVPHIDLPKSGSHLFQQASHLLQSCQKRPYVMAGAILYKKGVLCTQLSPDLTRQLIYLQKQMPHISRTTDFELPVGCRVITLFLTDEELDAICPLDPQAKRHCKVADFRPRRDSDRTYGDTSPSRRPKNFTRRSTCPNIGPVPTGTKSGDPFSEKSLNNFLRNEQRKSLQNKQDAMGVDQMSWRRKPRPNVSLSQVPIVECKNGESVDELDSDMVEQGYMEVDVSGHEKASGEESETDGSQEETKSQKPDETLSETEQLNKMALNDQSVIDKTDIKADNEPNEEVLEPTISDLEDNVELDAQKHESVYDSGIHQSYSDSASHLNVYVRHSPTTSSGSKFNATVEEVLSESSDDEENARSSFLSSDKRTVTLHKTSHHSVHHHTVDVHAQDDSKIEEVDVDESRGCSEQLQIRDSKCDKDEASVDLNSSELKNDIEDISNGNIGTDSDGKIKAESECDSTDSTANSNIGAKCSVQNEAERSDCNNEPEAEAKLVHCSNSIETAETSESSNVLQTIQNLPQSEEGNISSKDDGQNSTSENSKLKTESSDASDKENRYPDGELEDSIDDADDDDPESETDIVSMRNENPCINCLEMASKGENGRKGANTFYCSDCFAKLPTEMKNTNQEIIDFGEKDRHHSSGDQTEDNKYVRDLIEKVITSSFSSDVSTDSTISRYWTQEMDGLNDVTLYVQCHSDISLLLVLENPDKYQENLFHALWKGSLAQLADLDYYIKECIDSEEDAALLNNYTFARFDHATHRLTGNIDESQDDSASSRQQHHMIATLHAEFAIHHCLSDVNLRSQSSCCYGHHNQVGETFFKPEGPLKLGSGLPVPRDPTFALEHTVRSRLTKDRKISMV